MNPVVGLDVAKGESHVQAFLDQYTPVWEERFNETNQRGIKSFLDFLKEIEEVTGQLSCLWSF
jgi:hypothetical protein